MKTNHWWIFKHLKSPSLLKFEFYDQLKKQTYLIIQTKTLNSLELTFSVKFLHNMQNVTVSVNHIFPFLISQISRNAIFGDFFLLKCAPVISKIRSKPRIWDALCDLVPFSQLKKTWKTLVGVSQISLMFQKQILKWRKYLKSKFKLLDLRWNGVCDRTLWDCKL